MLLYTSSSFQRGWLDFFLAMQQDVSIISVLATLISWITFSHLSKKNVNAANLNLVISLLFFHMHVLYPRYHHIFFFWIFYSISGRKACTFCGDLQHREYFIITFVYIFMWTVTSVQVRLQSSEDNQR